MLSMQGGTLRMWILTMWSGIEVNHLTMVANAQAHSTTKTIDTNGSLYQQQAILGPTVWCPLEVNTIERS